MKMASRSDWPNKASEPRLSLRYTHCPGVIGQSIQSPVGCTGSVAGAAVATGLVGCGAGAGSGGAGEQAASASKSRGKADRKRRELEMILIAKEYGQKHGATLVLISDGPV